VTARLPPPTLCETRSRRCRARDAVGYAGPAPVLSCRCRRRQSPRNCTRDVGSCADRVAAVTHDAVTRTGPSAGPRTVSCDAAVVPPRRARGRRCSEPRCRAQRVSCTTACVIVSPADAPATVTRATRGRVRVDDRAARSAARALGVLPRCVRHLQTHVNRGGLAGRPARSRIGLCSLRRASSVQRAASGLQRKAL
jgi:hypothetical protein